MVLLGAYHQVKLHKNIVLLAGIAGSKKDGSTTSPSDTVSNTANSAVSKFGRTVKIESIIGIVVLFASITSYNNITPDSDDRTSRSRSYA